MGERTRGGRVYLLTEGIVCVLVDTGAPDGTLGAGQLIEAAGRKLHEVRLILLTHAHRGHAGNAQGLRDLIGAPVAASAEVAERLGRPSPPPPGWLRVIGASPAPIDPVRVDRVVAPGESLDLAGGIEVVDAPGHSPGCLAFRLDAPRALCVGDAATVTRAGLAPPPRRRCEDPDTAARTAARLADIPARVLAPGHGYPLVDGRLPTKRRG